MRPRKPGEESGAHSGLSRAQGSSPHLRAILRDTTRPGQTRASVRNGSKLGAPCVWEDEAGSSEPGMGEAPGTEGNLPKQQPLKETQKHLRNTQNLIKTSWV